MKRASRLPDERAEHSGSPHERVNAKRLGGSPVAARMVPFVIFCGLTWFQGKLGPDSQYWVYLAKTILGAWMIWAVRPLWGRDGMAVELGGGLWRARLVFGIWVRLDGLYPGLDQLLGGSARAGWSGG